MGRGDGGGLNELLYSMGGIEGREERETEENYNRLFKCEANRINALSSLRQPES